MGKLVLQIQRGNTLLGSWSLGEEPLELRLVSEGDRRELASVTVRGPRPGQLDEVRLSGPARIHGDDLTLPMPETTETTGGLPPETEEAPAVATPSSRNVPNLARSPAPAIRPPARPATSVPATPPQKSVASPSRARPSLAKPATGAPNPKNPPPAAIKQADEEISLTLSSALTDEPSVSLSLAELDLGEEMELPTVAPPIRPAEVWIRRKSEWRSGGQLKPGQRAVARGGFVRLAEDGSLQVDPGPELFGTATLPDGRSQDIPPNSGLRRISPGSNIVLGAGDYGLYVRSETPSR
jgi:hypothetical protein